MSTSYYDAQIDGVDNTIYPYTLRSASKGGSTTGKLGVIDLTVSTAANFPSSNVGIPSRYFITMPMDAYRTSTNSSAFVVTNETQGRDLTVVEPTATLTDYTCKFFGITSERRNVLEVHQGSTSSQPGDTLSYEGKFVGSILGSTEFDYLRFGLVSFNSSAIFSGNLYLDNDNVIYPSTRALRIASSESILALEQTGFNSTIIEDGDIRLYSTNTRVAFTVDAEGDKITQISVFSTNTDGECIRFYSYVEHGHPTQAPFDFDCYVRDYEHPLFNILTSTEAGVNMYNTLVMGNGAIRCASSIVSIGAIQSSGIISSTASGGGLRIRVCTTASDPPTDGELDNFFGAPATVGSGYMGFCITSASTNHRMVFTDGTDWYYSIAMSSAV